MHVGRMARARSRKLRHGPGPGNAPGACAPPGLFWGSHQQRALPPSPMPDPHALRPTAPTVPSVSAPTVSVVVPVHRGGAAFRACAAALAAALGPSDELVVVADGETDGAWRGLPPMPCPVRTVVRPRAGGPAAARNDGAREARGDILFFVDADVVVPSGAVERVRQTFAGEAEPAAVIGSYDDRPADAAFLSQYRNLLHHYTHQTAGATVRTFWGACGAVRRDVFEQAGGFDARYTAPSIEDVELGYRLSDAGHAIWLDKGLQVTHLKAWPAGQMLSTDLFRRAVPWTELLLRSGRTERQLNVDARSRASVAAVGVAGLALLAVPARPRATAAVSVAAAAGFVSLNMGFYRFLRERRGLRFALRSVPWHAAYAACSGVGFAIGTARHLAGADGRSPHRHRSPPLCLAPHRPSSSSGPARQA